MKDEPVLRARLFKAVKDFLSNDSLNRKKDGYASGSRKLTGSSIPYGSLIQSIKKNIQTDIQSRLRSVSETCQIKNTILNLRENPRTALSPSSQIIPPAGGDEAGQRAT